MKDTAVKSEIKPAILIIDKIGAVGEALSYEFSKDYNVIFVTKRNRLESNKNIIYVPFKGVPKAPNNSYKKIFLVDDGKSITRDSSRYLIKKARENQTPFYFIGSIRNIDLEKSDEIIKSYQDAKVLIFGDLFDDKITFDKESSISKFIILAGKSKNLKVPEDGLGLNYPVSFKDTIKLIVKASRIEVPKKVILLFPPHPVTDISLANTFQKIDPDIKVDFEKDSVKRRFFFPKNSQYAILSYDLKKKLSEIEFEDRSDNNTVAIDISQNKFTKPSIIFLAAIIFIFLLPLLSTLGYGFLAKNQLLSAFKSAEEGRFEIALDKSRNAQRFYNLALQTGEVLEFQAEIAKKEDRSKKIIKEINSGHELSKASTSIFEGIILFENIYKGESKNARNDLQKLVENFKDGYLILQGLKSYPQIPSELLSSIKNILPILETVSVSYDLLPELFGFDEEKKYLVLFTDNLELRPGGGVIAWAGVIRIKDARITNFQIVDPIAIDDRLQNNFNSPYFIRRYLNSPNLSFRDSSFSPNFIEVANYSSLIYKDALGQDIDGVIGVNKAFIKRILSTVGEIELNKSNKLVTPENVYDLSLGLRKEKDYYSRLFESILPKLNNASYLKLSNDLAIAILEKEIAFAFFDESIQKSFTANNFSSALADQRKDNENSINDYFGISESNLGKNPVNSFITREVVRHIAVSEDGKVSSDVKITYKNNSKDEKSFSQTYKNYLQLILPLGSRIQEVSVGGRNNEIIPAITDPSIYERTGFIDPSELEVDRIDAEDKSIFGFLVTIPEDSSKTITVKYSLPFNITETQKKINYSLNFYKQPGIESVPFSQTFNLPKEYTVVPDKNLPGAMRKDEELNFIISKN